MTGRQANVALEGANNENLAAYLMGKIAAATKVQSNQDFGIDFFCQLYSSGGAKSVDSDEIFGLQVKGGAASLQYGGMREGTWRFYEIAWLKSVMIPFFLGCTETNPGSLNLYSMGPIWRVLWLSAEPFRINVETDAAFLEPKELGKAQRIAAEYEHGDRSSWTVPLGPPLLRITEDDLSDAAFVESSRRILKRQIGIERRNLMYFYQGVAIHECLGSWATNDFVSQASYHRAMFWDEVPGKNIRALAYAVAPAMINLGVHLQWQNNNDAYRLIDVLEWLRDNGALDELGEGLLKQLEESRRLNRGPAPHIA